jgi:hypothetical protein
MEQSIFAEKQKMIKSSYDWYKYRRIGVFDTSSSTTGSTRTDHLCENMRNCDTTNTSFLFNNEKTVQD